MMGNFMLAAVDRIVRMALWCIVVYARRRPAHRVRLLEFLREQAITAEVSGLERLHRCLLSHIIRLQREVV